LSQTKGHRENCDAKKRNVALEQTTKHINELKQTIKEHEFSVDDIHTLESELKDLSEANDKAHVLLDELRKMFLASEEELDAVCDKLDSVTADYNDKIAKLQLVPNLGSNFAGMKAKVHNKELFKPKQSWILGVDLAGAVQQVAFSSKNKYIWKRTTKLRRNTRIL
jgi:SMC interacting uncharacterized protein involved in chromosome segregation